MSSLQQTMAITLYGAPDAAAQPVKAAPAMQLDMSSELLEEMLAAARSGKQPQIAFGRSPTLTFGARAVHLAHRPAKIVPEIYEIDGEESWSYAGRVSHKLSVQRDSDPSAGLDEALQMLKDNMASIEQERKARDTVTPANREAAKKSRLLKPTASGSKQGPEGHRGSADWTIKHKIPAVRHSLIHILAIGPANLQECSKKSCASEAVIEPILEKIGNKTANDEWELGNKAYKEVKPWSFRFSTAQRESIVERAIKAFDRLRIDSKDTIWQDLLPPQERGKGKVLSRLAFNSQGLRPSSGAKVVESKSALPKKAEGKKAGDLKSEEKVGGRSSPLPHKAKDVAGKSKVAGAAAKDDLKHSGHKVNRAAKAPHSPAHRPTKEAKPSMPAKALLNKPKNPSPLSKSPPVNASDFGDDHPARRTFSAAPSPSRHGFPGSAKRKAEETVADRSSDLSNKKARVDSLHHASRADRASPAIKRRADDHHRSTSSSSSDNTPLSLRRPMAKINGDKARLSSSLSKNSSALGAHKSSSTVSRPRSTADTQQHVSDDSSATSPDYALSHSRRLQMAEDFKRLYGRYRQLHVELSASAERPSQAQRSKLLEMHKRVADMKKALAA